MDKIEMKDFKLKVNQLFRNLNKQKTFAAQRFTCCRNCSWAEFEDPFGNGQFVFTTTQQEDAFERGELYVYGNYPENMKDLVLAVGLKFFQESPDTAIRIDYK